MSNPLLLVTVCPWCLEAISAGTVMGSWNEEVLWSFLAQIGHVCPPLAVPSCRVCGCTEADCAGCLARTGKSCHWVEVDLCSACVEQPPMFTVPIGPVLGELQARCELQRAARRNNAAHAVVE